MKPEEVHERTGLLLDAKALFQAARCFSDLLRLVGVGVNGTNERRMQDRLRLLDRMIEELEESDG